jgi:soluble P-type ATPase
VREIPQLRQDGRAAIAVVVQHADTLPALLEHADIVVHEVEGMVKLLGEMVEFLRLDEG